MKLIYTCSVLLLLFTASCKNETSADTKYQCPMKCEGEKTYDTQVNCPVCNMNTEPVN